MDVPTQLYGLIAVAEEHQKAVAAALEGLMQERAALEALQADLIMHSASMKTTKQETVSTIQNATEEVIRDAVRTSMSGSSQAVLAQFRQGLQPFLSEASKSAATMNEAAGEVQAATAWFVWRWLALFCCFLVCMLLLAWLATSATIATQRAEIRTLQGERMALAAEVLKLHDQVDVWTKKGGRAQFGVCGVEQRLCVRVNKKVGYGVAADYFVLSGY